MSLWDTFTSLFRNQRGSMQTATKTRTSTSTRTKVLLTLGVLGIVVAAAYGYAFAPGVQINRLSVIRRAVLPSGSGVSTTQKPPTGTSATTTATDNTSPSVVLNPTFSLFSTSTRVTVLANYSDNIGVVSCRLFANYINVGTMTLQPDGPAWGRASLSYTFPSAGRFPIAVDCMDAAGNPGSTGDVFITIAPTTTASTSTP